MLMNFCVLWYLFDYLAYDQLISLFYSIYIEFNLPKIVMLIKTKLISFLNDILIYFQLNSITN